MHTQSLPGGSLNILCIDYIRRKVGCQYAKSLIQLFKAGRIVKDRVLDAGV